MSVEMRVDMIGWEEAAREFGLMGARLERIATKAASAGATVIAGEAKKNFIVTTLTGEGNIKDRKAAPVNATKLTRRSGMLQDSIRIQTLSPGRVAVGPTRKYGRIHELGGTFTQQPREVGAKMHKMGKGKAIVRGETIFKTRTHVSTTVDATGKRVKVTAKEKYAAYSKVGYAKTSRVQFHKAHSIGARTITMPARPYLRPAWEQHKSEVHDAIVGVLKREVTPKGATP